jgi:hypothetical protein
MLSWVAMERIFVQQILSDAKHKQGAGRPLRSDAKRLTDGELLAKLRSFGIEIDRTSMERMCEQALSAEEIAKPLLDQRPFQSRREDLESDWIWICLTALWRRWLPDQPCFRYRPAMNC